MNIKLYAWLDEINPSYDIYESGADAMLKALRERKEIKGNWVFIPDE